MHVLISFYFRRIQIIVECKLFCCFGMRSCMFPTMVLSVHGGAGSPDRCPILYVLMMAHTHRVVCFQLSQVKLTSLLGANIPRLANRACLCEAWFFCTINSAGLDVSRAVCHSSQRLYVCSNLYSKWNSSAVVVWLRQVVYCLVFALTWMETRYWVLSCDDELFLEKMGPNAIFF